MSIGNSVLRSGLGAHTFQIGLSFDGDELAVTGYARSDAVWKVDGLNASARMSFGPFGGQVEFDAVDVYQDGELIDTLGFQGASQSLAPGMIFTEELTLSFAETG